MIPGMSLKKIRQAQSVTVKTTSATSIARSDGWANLATNLGVEGKDKSLAMVAVLSTLSQDQAEFIWRADDVAGRIIERLPEEMTREGFELEVEGDSGKDMSEQLMDAHDELGTLQHLYTAMTYARAFGGGAILLGVDDGQRDEARPLDVERVRSFDWMATFTARECMPFLWYDQPGPKFRQPRIYQLLLESPGGTGSQIRYVHESRIIPFHGVLVSPQHRARSMHRWGDSVLVRVLRVIQQFQSAFDSTAALLDDFSQAIFKMKGLAEMVASEDENDPMRIRHRVAAMNYTRSNLNAVILDAEGEDFQRHTTQLTGLPDTLDKLSLRVAAAADTPVTILMGQSPAGLNATGASDIRFWYDRVKAKQVQQLLPAINRITELKARALKLKAPAKVKGRPSFPHKLPQREGKPPRADAGWTSAELPGSAGPEQAAQLEPGKDNALGARCWSITFRPLWQLTDVERADLEKKVAEKDQIYINAQVLTPEEVALSRFKGDKWSMTTQLLDEDREAIADDKLEREATAAERMTEATTPPEPKGKPKEKP